MAVRWSASGQYHSSSAGLPGSAYTVTCWASLSADRNTKSTVWMIEGSNLVWMTTGTDGTTMRMEDAGGSTVGSLAMTVGDWYRIGVVWNGSSCTTYFGAATGALTSASGTLTGLSSPTGWKIGTGFTYNSNWFNGRLAAFKAWGTNLPAAQVTREFDYHTPLRPANLLRFHPFVSTETTDHSGLGRTLSGGSGSTTEPGPPIPWRPTPNQLIIPWDTSRRCGTRCTTPPPGSCCPPARSFPPRSRPGRRTRSTWPASPTCRCTSGTPRPGTSCSARAPTSSTASPTSSPTPPSPPRGRRYPGRTPPRCRTGSGKCWARTGTGTGPAFA